MNDDDVALEFVLVDVFTVFVLSRLALVMVGEVIRRGAGAVHRSRSGPVSNSSPQPPWRSPRYSVDGDPVSLPCP